MKERLKELDFIRSFATLAVIAIHVTGGYFLNHTNISFVYLWNQGVRFAVPIFIIISGFLLFYHDLDKKRVLLNSFYYPRLSKIIIPYIIWSFFYSIYYLYNELFESIHSIMFGQGFVFIKIMFMNIIQGTAAPHLYFIIIIFQLYILYPILHRLIKLNEKLVLVISFVITFYFQLADYFYSYEFFLLPKDGFKYYSTLIFPWIFYFVLGMYTVAKIKKDGSS